MEVSVPGGSMASAACPTAGTCAAQEGTQHLWTSQGHFHGARRSSAVQGSLLPQVQPSALRAGFITPTTDGETEAGKFGGWPDVTKLGSG